MKRRKNGQNKYVKNHFFEKIINIPKNRFYINVLLPDKNGCMFWIGSIKNNGYGFFRINGKNIHVHRYSYEHFYGIKIPDKMMILHKCDNRSCVSPDHLQLGTAKDNTQDMIIKKRNYWSYHPILTPEERKKIFIEIRSGCKISTIIRKYKISKSTCYKIYKEF